MKIKKKDNYLIATFLLLWYCYLNGLRRFFIPFSSVTVPIILLIVLFLVFRPKIKLVNKRDKLYCVIWVAVMMLILVDNIDFKSTLISSGIIQNIVLVSFMLFATYPDEKWIALWMSLTRIYALIHAVATIVFYYNAPLYKSFARLMFSGSALNDILRYYGKGWMSGLSAHFSTNGMILGIGIIFWSEYLFELVKQKGNDQKTLWFTSIATLAILYALILSSKRSPLLAALIAIAVTLIVYQKKHVGRRVAGLLLSCLVIFITYQYLANYIPGLTTIVDKSAALEDSSAGILNGRGGLWNLAFEMFATNPIFGCGFGSYKVYATNQGAITTTAHNFYLQVLAEFGICGIVLYVAAFLIGLSQGYHCLQSLSTNRISDSVCERKMAMRVALEIQIFVVIYNMTSTALYYYYIMIPYFLACAATRTTQYRICYFEE